MKSRFKGLRETTMNPDTRRLVQLQLDEENAALIMDMLLAKKRAADRRA